jgi:tripartite-type tricarboxylate transporter receptor subunit TctC
MSRRYFLFAALVTITASSGVSATDAFPSKPIRLIVPSTPGTGTDSIARLLSAKLKDGAGWTVVVENRPGASGTLALGETARAKPDGHEWVIGLSTNVALAPSLMKLTFDPMKDLTPVAYLVDTPLVFLVGQGSPHQTWKSFVDAAGKASSPLSYGSFGNGSSAHVAGELLRLEGGPKLSHIAYKGSSLALTDLMGGHIDAALSSAGSSLPLLQSGKVRALAVTSARRSSSLPSVPTFAELGFPGFNRPEWYGIFVRSGAPATVLDRIHDEVNKVLSLPDVRAALVAQGQDPRVESRKAFESMVQVDLKASTEIISKANVKME